VLRVGVIRQMEALQLHPSRPPPPIMERAYELADSGSFADLEAICHHLIKERYEDVFLWFEGRAATRVDLLNRCRRARSQIGTPSGQPSPTSSRASRWRTKAAEFCMLADRAKSDGIRQLYLRLAASYESLAMRAADPDSGAGQSLRRGLRRARGGHCHRHRHRSENSSQALPEELDTGHIKASAKVAGNLYRIATGSGREAVTAAIFWLKVRAG
jgi:hypothetical protein